MHIQAPLNSVLSSLTRHRAVFFVFLALAAVSVPARAQIPVVTTDVASDVTSNSATLNASVDPEGQPTTVSFEYGITTAYGSTVTATTAITGTDKVTVSIPVTGLAGDTIYHFQVIATNASGTTPTTPTQDHTFITFRQPIFGSSSNTPPNPPQVFLSALGALVVYPIEANGTATTINFQYGTTTSYGSTTPAIKIGSGVKVTQAMGSLGPLLPNTVYHYQLVAVSNRAGTNFSPDMTFTTLDIQTQAPPNAAQGSPAVGTTNFFHDFGSPAINQNGKVVFSSTLTATPTSLTPGPDPGGIWTDDAAGNVNLIAEINTTVAPGTTSAKYKSFNYPVINNSGEVAFFGVLQNTAGQVTGATNSGVWSSSSGALALVARSGTQAPDCPVGATFDFLTSVGISDANTLVVSTLNLNGSAGVASNNNMGIWEGTTAGNLTLLLRTGDIVGTKTILRFNLFPVAPVPPIQTRNFATNTGDLVTGAQFTDKTTGIVTVEGGTQALVEASSDPSFLAPGTGGATYASFGNPIINTGDNIAFQALLNKATGVVAASNDSGIWAGAAGALQLIARTGQPATGTLSPSNFLVLNDPVINSGNEVAFRGVTTGPTATNSGIWTSTGGALTLVAQTGTQAPGCPTGSKFQTFNSWGLADTGQVVFAATLIPNSNAGISFTNDSGLWAVDSNGNLQLIVQTSDVIDGKTVQSIGFVPGEDLLSQQADGQTRGFSQVSGDITYLVTFTDKTTAIFTVSF